ncbi:MAG: hypothetical protein QNK19_17995 [Xanthomonadales bacterium]|nr:hypothetical protein [Xanthomonadales bacterium]
MRKQQNNHSSDTVFPLHELFEPPVETETQQVVESSQFNRIQYDLFGKATLVLDRFPDNSGASCCFVRILSGKAQSVHFVVQGANRIETCPSGGWVIKPDKATLPSYWIPQPPLARKLDSQRRILSEEKASIAGFIISSEELSVEIEVPGNMDLDWTIWQFPAKDSGIHSTLDRLLVLERQPFFLWTSQTRYQSPADMYLYLVHGHVYVNRFIWPRMWKICSELDAYGLYIVMSGLELATGKIIYSLLKRQLLFSVIARQAEDGGWHHGEWTDLMESHYRFHNGAMLLLQAALKERPDEVVGKSLARAAHYISCHTDNTDLGLWFLHDSLEEDAEMMRELCRQTGSTWIPARTLGKSPTNKLILNTHLDSIVTLEQYRNVSGDNQYMEQVTSARAATRSLLALRPAELLYRIMYRAIRLTLLPEPEAKRLPAFVRAIKRLTWKYLIPQLLPRVKRVYPRLVMPGGYIERHLSMPHYDINYHPVNIMDLARLWRCFPDEDFGQILQKAVEAVADSSILQLWAESKPRNFSVVVWADALYQLCTLKQDAVYRRLLAEGIITIVDAGLGLPPSLLGADAEAVKTTDRVSCPSPTDRYLQVANLSCNGHIEILVINPSDVDRELQWEGNANLALSWTTVDGQSVPAVNSSLCVHSRKWIWGREM